LTDKLVETDKAELPFGLVLNIIEIF
jgi:hypothetical protein